MEWLNAENVVAIGTAVLGIRSGRANRRLGLFDETPNMADATLVLLRIENDGSQGVARDDYTGPERHGLTAVFTGRTIRGVSVTQPTDTDHLMDHFTADRGFGYDGNTLRIPRVPLNRGDHFKLLVLTLSVVTLATIVVVRDDSPPPIGCERGTLTVTGSTAFAPWSGRWPAPARRTARAPGRRRARRR
ncbi:hypothetical protein AQJ58_32360 [Streptomyces sp. DSM 15324]|nr:hypothetical protein AQJ58_32360 [Streptomyces sp. DSM 15324]